MRVFQIKWTPMAREQFNALRKAAEKSYASRQKSGKRKPSKQEGLFKQVHKTVVLLGENPRHPGLQTHEFHSIDNPYDKKKKVFEAYAQQKTPAARRVFWCYSPGKQEITIIAITPHP